MTTAKRAPRKAAPEPKTDPDVYVCPVRAGAALRNAYAQYKSWEAEFERLKKAAQDKMGDAKVLRDADGNEIATWSPSKRTALSQSAHKEAQPECHALYSVTTEVRTFKVNPLPLGDDDE